MNLIKIFKGEIGNYAKKDGSTFQSAFLKKEIFSATIDSVGIIHDSVADTKHHGGEHKALLGFSKESYMLDELKGSYFGENLLFKGLSEDNVCIGDIYKIGLVVVEVSQPREPCWKLNFFNNRDDLMKISLNSGITGWYFKVLNGGVLNAGDSVELLDRVHFDLTIKKLNMALNRKLHDNELNRQIIDCQKLSPAWKKSFSKVVDINQ